MQIVPFKDVRPGSYIKESVHSDRIHVKRGSGDHGWVEGIGTDGLPDGSDQDVDADVLVCLLEEPEWPEIDYKERIRAEFTWDQIKEAVPCHAYLDDDGDPRARVWLGTTLGIMPSGKIYAFWTSNQTDEDMNRDGQYHDALEAVAEECGLYVFWEDDSCFVGRSVTFEEVATHAGFRLRIEDGFAKWHGKFTEAEASFDDEDEAWEDCCRANNLVEGL